MTTALERAEARLAQLFARARNRLAGAGLGVTGGVPNSQRDPLTAAERDSIASFSSSDTFTDRSRTVKVMATDPATGRRGEVEVSVNSLHLIDPSHDTAKVALRAKLEELVNAGLLSWDTLRAPIPTFPTVGSVQNDYVIAVPPDTRLSSGLWADFPVYSGIAMPHLNAAGTALGVTRASPRVLPNFPLPNRWRKLFAGPKFYERAKDRNGRETAEFAYPQTAMIRDLEFLVVNVALLVKGANASPEWHPGVMAFNNGSQAPCRAYPPDLDGFAFDDVDARYQYREEHRFAVPTSGARGSATGFVLTGKSDPLWLTSARVRQRVAHAENHQMPLTNDWGKIAVADAAADFVRWANMASFLLDVGSTAHVHAATECFNAVVTKAMDELGLARGGDLDAGIARERAAREQRAQTRADLVESYIARLELAADQQRADAVSSAMEVLHGGLVASAQLFLANPYVGAVALAITVVASFITWVVSGGLAERHYPERVNVKDGSIRVRAEDEDGDPDGDVYGGNSYPWTRRDAVYGKPVIRVRDMSGRELE